MNQAIPRHFTIQTARCRLRAPTEADIPYVFSATRVPGFNDGMEWDPPTDLSELSQPLQGSRLAWATGEAFAFTIEALQSGIFLGRVVIQKTTQSDVWKIGFWTHPQHQRKGYMTESAQAILEFGFAQLEATQIEASYALWNHASRRVLEKVGMRFLEYIAQGFMKQGKWVKENKMVISKQDWLKKSGLKA